MLQAAVVLWFLHQSGKGTQLTRHIRASAAEDDFGGATRLEVREARSQLARRAGKGQSLRVSHRHVGAVVLVHLDAVTEMQREVSRLLGDALDALAPGAPVREGIDSVAACLVGRVVGAGGA